MLTRTLILATAAVALLSASGPARADWDGWRHGGHDRGDWRGHEWRGHPWRSPYPGYVYAPPPAYYVPPPPPVYYAPPPVFYGFGLP
jgi:hypothetical protein